MVDSDLSTQVLYFQLIDLCIHVHSGVRGIVFFGGGGEGKSSFPIFSWCEKLFPNRNFHFGGPKNKVNRFPK